MPIVEIWGQESDIKGTRLIRFEQLNDPEWLKWLGPLGESDDVEQYKYTKRQLRLEKWQFIENL